MKQGWEIKKLGEVVKKLFAGGDKPKLFAEYQTEQLSIPVYANGISLDGLVGYTDKAIVEEESITISARGTIGFCCVRKSPFVPIVRLITLIPSEDIKTEYLCYVLRNTKFDNNGVAIPQLTIPMIREMLIPIPPRAEQERIVAELDCLSGVIEKKKEQLRELDALAQSIFYDMFGDPISNEKGWEVKNINEVCSILGRIGFRGYTTNDLVSSPKDGAISLSPSNIINNHLDYSKCTYISWYKYEESPEIKICNEDILLVKTGSSYGKCALVENLPHKATINPQFVVLKNIKINNRYLTSCLQSPSAKCEFDKFTIGAAIPTFSQKNLGNMQIILPPMELQREFAEKIEVIEKQKELIKDSIKETETLFNERLHYWFEN